MSVLGNPEWLDDERFDSLEHRLGHQDELERLVGEATVGWDGYQLMQALQAQHVPAGVCQMAQDRYETDPQLAHLHWLVELDQAEIGTWPFKDHPVMLSETPAYIGGKYNRAGPNYGQDTDTILCDSYVPNRRPARVR